MVVTAHGHRINLDGPVDPWEQVADEMDRRAVGYDGWYIQGGRQITNAQGKVVGRMQTPATGRLIAIKLEHEH